MHTTTPTDEVLAVVRTVPVLPRTATDEEVLADVAAWEELGRVVDAHRVRAAAEVEWRSRRQLAPHGLAEQYGARSGADLVASVARVGRRKRNDASDSAPPSSPGSG